MGYLCSMWFALEAMRLGGRVSGVLGTRVSGVVGSRVSDVLGSQVSDVQS